MFKYYLIIVSILISFKIFPIDLAIHEAINEFTQNSLYQPSLEFLKGGMTGSKIIKFTHKDTNYVLKTLPDNNDGKQEYLYAKLACKLGIGAHLYTNNTNYMITDFVAGHSLNAHDLDDNPQCLPAIARMLSKLHSASAPCDKKIDNFQALFDLYKRVHAAGSFKKLITKAATHIQFVQNSIRDMQAPLCPCHRDLNSGNIIVGGNNIKIIDWGCGCLSNPFYDLAHFFTMNAISKSQEEIFLKAYNPEYLKPEWRFYLNQIRKVTFQTIALCLLLHVQNSCPSLFDHEKIKADHELNYYVKKFIATSDREDMNLFYHFGLALLNASLIDNQPSNL